MTLDKNYIDSLLKDAMKSGMKNEANVYRLVKAEFIKAEKEHGIEPDNDKCIKLVYKMIEQRKDSISQYTKAGRTDLATAESVELAILKKLVPETPSEEKVIEIVDTQVVLFKNAMGSVSPKDTKQIIESCNKVLVGVPNIGKYVSQAIKKHM